MKSLSLPVLGAILVALVLVLLFFSPLYEIDQTQEALIVQFGAQPFSVTNSRSMSSRRYSARGTPG